MTYPGRPPQTTRGLEAARRRRTAAMQQRAIVASAPGRPTTIRGNKQIIGDVETNQRLEAARSAVVRQEAELKRRQSGSPIMRAFGVK